MPRWPRRRPSMRPENVKRRLTNRVVKIIAALVIAGGYWVWNQYIAPVSQGVDATPAPATDIRNGDTQPRAGKPRDTRAEVHADRRADNAANDIDALIDAQQGNRMVTVDARVTRVLADDNDGSPHQRFLVETPAGNRVLVAHNIALAPRVEALAAGDEVRIRGEFEWNDRGGVIHWTHRDPAGKHEDGWIERDGVRVE